MFERHAAYYELGAVGLLSSTAGFVLFPVRGSEPDWAEIAAAVFFAVTLYGLFVFTILLRWRASPATKAGASAGLVVGGPLLLGLAATPFASSGGLVDIPPVAVVPFLLAAPVRPIHQPIADFRRRWWADKYMSHLPDPDEVGLDQSHRLPRARVVPLELHASHEGLCLDYRLSWTVPGSDLSCRKSACFDTRASLVSTSPCLDSDAGAPEDHPPELNASLAATHPDDLRRVAPNRLLALPYDEARGAPWRRPLLLDDAGRRLGPPDPKVTVRASNTDRVAAGLDRSGTLWLALHASNGYALDGSEVVRFPGNLSIVRIHPPNRGWIDIFSGIHHQE